MKQRFETFLLEKRAIINRAIRRYPNYSELIYTNEDYLRMCEFALYRIWRDDLFIDRENRDGCIFMDCCKVLQSKHREAYHTGKNKLHLDAIRLNHEYDEGDEWERINSSEEIGYRLIGSEDIWSIVRELLKKEKHVELFISYYKSDCKSLSEFHKEYKPIIKYESMRRFFDKYIKILRKNRGYFLDFV